MKIQSTLAIVVILTPVFRPLLTTAFNGPRDSSEHVVNRDILQDAAVKTLSVEGGTPVALRLTATARSNTGRQAVAFVTANDLVVAGTTIIPTGSGAAFGSSDHAARRLGTPGEIVVELEGIHTRSGKIVLPLKGSLRVIGKDPRSENALVDLLMAWQKGGEASIPVGTLVMTTAHETTSFDVLTLDQLHSELARPITVTPPAGYGRLHLYALARSTSVRVDDARIGTLGRNRYVCWRVAPGLHTIHFGESEMSITVQSGTEYYIQLNGAIRPLLQTPGYLFGQARLEPAKNIANEIPCW